MQGDKFIETVRNGRFIEAIEHATQTAGNNPDANTVTPVAAVVYEPGRDYYNDMVQYESGNYVTSDCAEISFYNIGTSTLLVNGVPFPPQQGIAFDGKKNETDRTKYTISFTGAGINLAFVIRKIYL